MMAEDNKHVEDYVTLGEHVEGTGIVLEVAGGDSGASPKPGDEEFDATHLVTPVNHIVHNHSLNISLQGKLAEGMKYVFAHSDCTEMYPLVHCQSDLDCWMRSGCCCVPYQCVVRRALHCYQPTC